MRNSAAGRDGFDAVDLAVMSNRFESIVREMESTIFRTARSSVVGVTRDLSCCIVSGNDELLFSAEGLIVHVYGAGLLAKSMRELHPEFSEGDAYLHNDPYRGNTHPGDHSILVPVFVDGEHIFTTIVKAHQADIGAALPTTYSPAAVDVYAEGALIFPCVKIQQNRTDVADIIRMCQVRIRVFDVWYGDYLAALAAARVGEKRLVEFVRKFGAERTRAFVKAWLDYSESRAREAIRELPAGRIETSGSYDPVPGAPDGIPIKMTMDIDAQKGEIVIDLRDNPDCLPNGENLSEATAKNAAIAAVLVSLNSRPQEGIRVPLNAGTFRCFDVLLRENCVVGIPRHPASCSNATGGPSLTVSALGLAALAERTQEIGAAHSSSGAGPALAVISGVDSRTGRPYVTQISIGSSGGPATKYVDGWLNFLAFPAAGLQYLDSIEVTEQKYPVIVQISRIRPDSEGAGRRRGAPGSLNEYGPRAGNVVTIYYNIVGGYRPAEGVCGGEPAALPTAYRMRADGITEELPSTGGAVELRPGERIGSRSSGGGGFGSPLEREPELVLEDVKMGFITSERAKVCYGVEISGDVTRPESLTIDQQRTRQYRAQAQ
jgi:N-methylhydantoinase B